MTRATFLAALGIAVVLPARPGTAGEREALVIGNSGYAGDAVLENPGNDADAMEAALKELGFSVIKRKDLSLTEMEDALAGFRRALSKGGLGLFFYAGHGVQVRGDNYLVPIGARMREEYEVRHQCLSMGLVLDAMEESQSNLKVLILDCCRDNPYRRAWKRGTTAKGLAPPSHVPQGTMIAFSTSPNETAADGGRDRKNSPYTEHLVATLRSRPAEGLELGDVFRKASRAVKQQTGQVPWLNQEASLEEYYLWRGTAASVALRPQPVAPQSHPAPSPKAELPSEKPASPPSDPQQREITNSIGMKLVLIPAGEFMMGSPDSEENHNSDESPQHRVRITRPFYLGQYEVTQGEYQQVMGTNPSDFSATGTHKEKVSGQDTSRFPVEKVSWNDAVEFCRRLSQKEGRTYRLPTEAEWEYACRAGTTTPFNFGSLLNGAEANCNGNNPYGTSYKGPYLQRTTTVGSYRPNAFGLYDMHGNVWEWCADRYDGSYYAGSPQDDPTGPSWGLDRVRRGGSWNRIAGNCRSAYRVNFSPELRYYYQGFRVARVAAD